MKKSLIIVLAVILIGGGVLAFALTREDNNDTAANTGTNTQPSHDDHEHDHDHAHHHEQDESAQQPAAESATIIYTDNGFNPSSYKVKSGSTVVVKNESSQVLEFSSDDHPAHTDNSELNMTALSPGESGEFKPERTGRWGFHNHENAAHTGSLVVE